MVKEIVWLYYFLPVSVTEHIYSAQQGINLTLGFYYTPVNVHDCIWHSWVTVSTGRPAIANKHFR